MDGQLVCWSHGGAATQNRAAAQRRLHEQRAEKELSNLKDVPMMTSMGDVYDSLLRVASVADAWSQILQERVAELRKPGYRGLTAEQVKADVQLFERALDRSAKVGETIVRLGLEERKIALDERTATLLHGCITAVLNDLEITPEQRELAKTVVPARLRAITA
jgi:hypothetical protein